ncbi:MAG: DUF692 domain-containing protein [Gammaproteobacteria bacterium]|nr:DUF692 domain-containing protein [Gammaproteobacteria bacterium]
MMTGNDPNDRRPPYLGFGLQLRREHIPSVIQQHPDVGWFEIISENYLDTDNDALRQLDKVREHYPVTMHGISLAVGSPWPLNQEYLAGLKNLISRVEPAWISDHLCWSGADNSQGKMLPLPFAEETIDHLVNRIQEVQGFLGRQILLENVPAYRNTPDTQIPEAEFIREVATRSDSLILLDIANLHITCVTRGLDADDYLQQLPAQRVQQIHLAGSTQLCDLQMPGSGPASDPIWELYRSTIAVVGPVSTIIERVDCIPSLDEMVWEVSKAKQAAKLVVA